MNKKARKNIAENISFLLINQSEFAFQLYSNDRWKYLKIDLKNEFPNDTYSKLSETELHVADDPLFGYSTITIKEAILLFKDMINNDPTINKNCLLEIIEILKLKS